jgi:hypothetical protein
MNDNTEWERTGRSEARCQTGNGRAPARKLAENDVPEVPDHECQTPGADLVGGGVIAMVRHQIELHPALHPYGIPQVGDRTEQENPAPTPQNSRPNSVPPQ